MLKLFCSYFLRQVTTWTFWPSLATVLMKIPTSWSAELRARRATWTASTKSASGASSTKWPSRSTRSSTPLMWTKTCRKTLSSWTRSAGRYRGRRESVCPGMGSHPNAWRVCPCPLCSGVPVPADWWRECRGTGSEGGGEVRHQWAALSGVPRQTQQRFLSCSRVEWEGMNQEVWLLQKQTNKKPTQCMLWGNEGEVNSILGRSSMCELASFASQNTFAKNTYGIATPLFKSGFKVSVWWHFQIQFKAVRKSKTKV